MLDTQHNFLTVDLPEEEMRHGRTLKRLLDGYNREARAGHL